MNELILLLFYILTTYYIQCKFSIKCILFKYYKSIIYNIIPNVYYPLYYHKPHAYYNVYYVLYNLITVTIMKQTACMWVMRLQYYIIMFNILNCYTVDDT